MLERGEWDVAVVVAQTACEVPIAHVISERLQVIGERLEELGLPPLRTHLMVQIRTHSLIDRRARKVWDDLMEDALGDADAWQEYSDHVARRNAVVHQGMPVSRCEAATLLAADRAMIEHVGRPYSTDSRARTSRAAIASSPTR